MFSRALLIASALSAAISASPIEQREIAQSSALGDSTNFPDPGLFIYKDSTYYTYSTTSGGKNVPVASLSRLAPLVGGLDLFQMTGDALPLTKGLKQVCGKGDEDCDVNKLPSWILESNIGVWAPEVTQLKSDDGELFSLTFSAASAETSDHHCIAIAHSTSPQGPFAPVSNWKPICGLEGDDELSGVGAIDSSYYWEGDDLYLLYKIDGNSEGKTTMIMIQQVEPTDGYTKIGDAWELLRNGDGDGGVVEAPSLVHSNGWYILFYSSNSYATDKYDVSWVYSSSLHDSFERLAVDGNPNAHRLLVSYGENHLFGPGGMSCQPDDELLCTFHEYVDKDHIGGSETRELRTAKIAVETDDAGKPWINKNPE